MGVAMRIIKIKDGTLPTGGGAVLLLSAAQVAPRRHNLAKAEACGEVMLAEARVPMQFKAGEIVGVDSVPKVFAEHVRDATPEDGEMAKAMIAAAMALGEPAQTAPEAAPKSGKRTLR